MARGDALFCRLDVDVWTTRKMTRLKNAGSKCFYLFVWTLSVRERSSYLERSFVQRMSVALLNVTEKTARGYLNNCLDADLLVDAGEGMLYIRGARVCHPKLQWKDDGLFAPYGERTGTDTGPDMGDIRDRTKKDRHTNNRDKSRGIVDKGREEEGIKDITREIIRASEEAIEKTVDEVAFALKVEGDGKDRDSIRRVVSKHSDNLPKVMDALLAVVDRMQSHIEGEGEPVKTPVALFTFHVKRLTEGV